MKYGISTDKNNNPEPNSAREFNDVHWANLEKMANSHWIPFPKKKVFISFCEADRNKMKVLRRAILNSELLAPIIIEEKREGAKILGDLVVKGIEESEYFIVILSEKSFHTQFVNQEIGVAKAKEDHVEIIPIVQDSIINELKGFITKNIQLAYKFHVSENDKRDRLSFRNSYKDIILYIEQKVLQSIKKV
jgi:hypothetical protein